MPRAMTASWADTTTRTIRQTRLTLAGASAGLSGAVVVASITAVSLSRKTKARRSQTIEAG